MSLPKPLTSGISALCRHVKRGRAAENFLNSSCTCTVVVRYPHFTVPLASLNGQGHLLITPPCAAPQAANGTRPEAQQTLRRRPKGLQNICEGHEFMALLQDLPGVSVLVFWNGRNVIHDRP